MVLERFRKAPIPIDEASKQIAIRSYISSRGDLSVAEFGFPGARPISRRELKGILNERGIVEVAKDENLFEKLIQFFGKIVSENIKIRRSRDLVKVRVEMPLTFGVSIDTIEQVLVNIINRVTTKEAVGLIITPEDDDRFVLIGREHNILNVDGQETWTIPATTANSNEDIAIRHLRVIQHEGLFPAALEGEDLIGILRQTPPSLITRIRVGEHQASAYHLRLSRKLLEKVGSPKLTGLSLHPVREILSMGKHGVLRPGGYEVGLEYARYLAQVKDFRPKSDIVSELNERVIELSAGYAL